MTGLDLACQDLMARLLAKKMVMCAAESCTGGLIMAHMVGIAGSSAVVDRGFVTYSNQAKCDMLGIDAALIDDQGAVSQRVAQAMALGALDHSAAHLAIAVTGIAGPAGGSDAKPVGTVFMAAALKDGDCLTQHHIFKGNRDQIRRQAAEAAIRLALLLT